MNENRILTRLRVVEAHRNICTVRSGETEKHAVLSGKLMHAGEYPIVGDWVLTADVDESTVMIMEIEERKSFLSRPDRNGHADGYVKTMREQPMVANIDYVFIITSVNQDFSVERIARYAAITAAGGATPVAVLTKADLTDDPAVFIEKVRGINDRLRVHAVSACTGAGMDQLRDYFRPGVTIALLGSSGAGKSTLINTLAGRRIMRVSAIRETDSKGRHTTTHRQMTDLNGTFIIDTPGMRELGMCDAENGIDDTFEDIAQLTGLCRFSDCSHGKEPGCAVRQALETGRLSRARWEMYSRMRSESTWAGNMKKQKNIAKQRKLLNEKRKEFD